MGQYTNTDKVKTLFRDITIEPATGTPAQDTAITTEELDDFIDEVEATMNMKLATCYKDPHGFDESNNPESMKVLRQIATWKTAAIVKNILQLDKDSSKSTKQGLKDGYGHKAMVLMEKICPDNTDCNGCRKKPEIPLIDAPMLDEAPTAYSSIRGSTGTAVFKKNGANW